jgi:hypothetical protein
MVLLKLHEFQLCAEPYIGEWICKHGYELWLEEYTQQIAAEDVNQKEVDEDVEEQIEELHGGAVEEVNNHIPYALLTQKARRVGCWPKWQPSGREADQEQKQECGSYYSQKSGITDVRC